MAQLKPTRGLRLNKSHPLSRGLVGCWIMNEGSGARCFDSGGKRLDLGFENGPAWCPGRHGNAVLFDRASSQYLQVEKPTITSFPFSAAAWFNSNDDASNQTFIFVGNKDKTYSYCDLDVRGAEAGDYVRAFQHHYSDTHSKGAYSTKGFTKNKWHLASGVWKSKSARYAYLDGGNKGSNEEETGEMSGHNRTAIGGARDSSPGNYMSGKIGAVYIWDRIVTELEFKWLYRNPFCMFAAAAPILLEAEPPLESCCSSCVIHGWLEVA